MSDALSEDGDESLAEPDPFPEPTPLDEAAPGQQRTAQPARSGRCCVGVFLLDAGVLFVTSVLAWYWQGSVDNVVGQRAAVPVPLGAAARSRD